MRPTRLALSLLAVLVLTTLMVGIPLALVLAVGWPVPDPVPGLTELGDMVAGRAPVPADLVISVLGLVMWLLWLQVAWAVVVEVLAIVRGRLARRAPILPGLQLSIGKLVTAATLLSTSFSARPVAAGPLPDVAAAIVVDPGMAASAPGQAAVEDGSTRSSGPSLRPYLTQPGDTWWGIAEDAYGSGTRWKEIRNLNLGRTMDDGSVISVATDLLRPEWRLLLPAGATVEPTPEAAVADAAPADDAVDVGSDEVVVTAESAVGSDDAAAGSDDLVSPAVVVEAGDTVWDLAEDDLEALGQQTSTVAVAERVDEIAEINRAALDGNPDLIYPGQRLELPSRPALAARAPAPPAGPVEPGTGGGDEPADEAEQPPDGAADGSADEAEQPPDGAADGSADEAEQPPDGAADGSAGEQQAGSEPASGEVIDPPVGSGQAPPVTSTTAPPPTTAAPATTAAPGTAAPDEPMDSTGQDGSDGDGGEASGEDAAASPLSPAGETNLPPITAPDAPPSTASAGAASLDTASPDDNGADAGAGLEAGADSDLAGARASSPEWIPVATTQAPADLSTTPTARARAGAGADRTVPASSAARALVDRSPIEPPPQTPSAELPTVAPADGIELATADTTASPSPGAEEGLDTTSSRAPIVAAVAGITLIGGYLFRAKGRRRKTVMQSRHPGRRPEPSTRRRTRTLTRRLAAAAEHGHPDFVNLGLRALGRLLHDVPADELPHISGLWVSHNRMVLALADDSPRRPPPAPFTPFADGSGWSLEWSHFDEIRAIARGANGPLPLLTTVGTTTSLDLALTTNSRAPAEAYGLASSLLFAVDLEAGRVISVDGPRRSEVIEALTMMAIELATSETADQAEIVCVGFGQKLATFDRVMVVDDLSSIMGDLEDITSRAVYASADASPFATRVGDGAADTWNPVIVFHTNPDDPDAAALVDLADQTEGGVTVVCGYPTESGWRFLVDGDQVHCPDLPASLAQHRFTRPQPGDLDDIVDLFGDDGIEIDLDDEFWASFDDESDRFGPLPDLDAGDETGVGSSWQAMPAVAASGRRRGAPAGPSVDDELPPVDLRHSTMRRTDDVPPPVPPMARARPSSPIDAESEPDRGLDDEPPSAPPASDDRTPAPPPGGRHLYVVDDPTHPEPAGGVGDALVPDTSPPADDQPTIGTETGGARTEPRPTAESAVDDTNDDANDDAEDATDDAAGPGATPTDLRVEILGNFTLGGWHVGDRAKPWKYTKTAELVLYLLLHPDGASQDLLMEQLFPEQPANRPRLNQLVSDARTKALGVDEHGAYHLPHASPTEPFYRLGPSIDFDLRDFARHCARARRAESPQVQAREWTAALELVKGRPFTLPHDGYGWAMPEVEATIVKVEEAAVALADVATELGDHRLAVWATKKGLLTGTGYYELLVRRGQAALLLQDPEEIVRAFADLQVSLDHTGAPEEGVPDLDGHPELADVYNELSDGRGRDRTP